MKMPQIIILAMAAACLLVAIGYGFMALAVWLYHALDRAGGRF